jgi:predicted MFS family arabinose efflux permease
VAAVVAYPQVDARDRSARIGVAGAYAVQGLCFAGVLTKVPALQQRFGFSTDQLTLILLAVPVVAGVGSLLAGAFAPRVGSALVLRVSGVCVCATVATIGAVRIDLLLYLAVGLFGLFVGAVDATMNMQGVRVQRRYGRSILNSFHGWWSLAGITGSLANAGTARLHWSIDASLLAIAGLGVVLALLAGPRLLPHGEADHETPTGPAAAPAPVAWRPVLAVGLAVMLMYIGESSTSNWSGVLLQNALHASGSVVPLGLGAYLACQLAGRAMADRVVRRFGSTATVAAGGLVAAAGFGLVVAANRPWLAVAGFGVVGVGLCVVVPLAFSAAGALDPTGSGVVIARVNLFNYLGFVAGAALVGPIADAAGLRWAFAVPGALVLGVVGLAPVFAVADRAGAARTGPQPSTVDETG